eukprot:9368245-Heterocapsa_arctica.AAC.1
MILVLPSLKRREAGSANSTEQRTVNKVRLASQACSVTRGQRVCAKDFMQFGAQGGNARGFRPNGEAHALVNAGEIEYYTKSDHELRRQLLLCGIEVDAGC